MNRRVLGTVCSSVLMLGLASTAQAALVDNGGGLIYDNELDITWLSDANYAQTTSHTTADANGRMTWDDATAWAAGLDYNGITGWRLPSALSSDGTGPCWYQSCQTSEMQHMFYQNLNGVAATAGSGWYSPISATDESFLNIFDNEQDYYYWSNTESATDSGKAWIFDLWGGSSQKEFTKNPPSHQLINAWAVKDGNVAPVPLPAAVWLFGAGLAGLGVFGRSKRRS